jgi:predicted RNA binding protein YcfA (HicA-like mRNA interferase family)
MTKADKLKEKLTRGQIDANEGFLLLNQSGWKCERQKGSHQTWARGSETLTLAVHGKDLKRYQIKAIQKAVLNENEEE